MARITMLIFWICHLFLSCEAKGRHTVVSDLKSQLQFVKNNTIKTIKTSAGDVFDCIDIYKQPGLAHPKLKDHKIQIMPTISLNKKEQSATTTAAEEEEVECPQGSVPIQRLELDNLVKENLPKEPEPLSPKTPPVSPMVAANGPYKKFWAVTKSKKDLFLPKYFRCCDTSKYTYGGGATLNLYSVPNVGPHDESSSLMWLMNEETGITLRAGWQVRPDRYNDRMSRLFIEWTLDNDQTNCVNNDCPGFVLVTPKPKIGAAFLPVSKYLGPQYAISVFIYKDLVTSNWWFAVGDRESVVGYWPKAVVNGLPFGRRMDFGGFVSCPPDKKCPSMGNGHRPGAIDETRVDHACFIKGIHYYNQRSERVNFTNKMMDAGVSDYSCCTVGKFNDKDQSFTFGGAAY